MRFNSTGFDISHRYLVWAYQGDFTLCYSTNRKKTAIQTAKMLRSQEIFYSVEVEDQNQPKSDRIIIGL